VDEMQVGDEYGYVRHGDLVRVVFLGVKHTRRMRWGDNWRTHNFYQLELSVVSGASDSATFLTWERETVEKLQTWSWWERTIAVCKILDLNAAKSDTESWKIKGLAIGRLGHHIHSIGLDNPVVQALGWPLRISKFPLSEAFIKVRYEQMSLLHEILLA